MSTAPSAIFRAKRSRISLKTANSAKIASLEPAARQLEFRLQIAVRNSAALWLVRTQPRSGGII